MDIKNRYSCDLSQKKGLVIQCKSIADWNEFENRTQHICGDINPLILKKYRICTHQGLESTILQMRKADRVQQRERSGLIYREAVFKELSSPVRAFV